MATAGFAQAAQMPGPLYPGQRYTSGEGTLGAALGDLDGDGDQDLVVFTFLPDGLGVRLGRGDGTFGVERRVAVPRRPIAIALVDVNGDGALDALVADDQGVTTLLGRGDGALDQTHRADSFDVADMGVADLDGDGLHDVVLARYGGLQEVFLGDGTGRFTLLERIRNVYPIASMVLADLDGDGDADLAAFNRTDGPGVVRFNDGSGGFDEAIEIAGLAARRVVAGDIDGDGDLDLLGTLSHPDEYGFRMIRNLGGGDFAEGERVETDETSVATLAVLDANGDGRPDLLTAGPRPFRQTGEFLVFDGRPDGTLAPPRRSPVGENPMTIQMADLNGDGLTDAVVANEDTQDVSVLLAAAPGEFIARQRLPTGEGPDLLALADFTGDGLPDALTTERTDHDLVLLAGRGDGTFEPAHGVGFGLPVSSLLDGELTGDGRADLVLGVGSGPAMLLAGDGAGGFAPPVDIDDMATPMGLHDMDGDGDLDVVAIDFPDQRVVLLSNDGGGRFERRDLITRDGVARLAVTDFDGDGHPDLLVALREPTRLVAYRNRGDLRFDSVGQIGFDGRPGPLVVGDLDGDGDPDAAIATSPSVGDVSDTVTVIENLGGGAFVRGPTYALLGTTSGSSPRDIDLVDVDRDGVADLLITSSLVDAVEVMLGEGGGPSGVRFSPSIRFDLGVAPESLAVADLNGNGRPDLVATAEQGDEVSVLLHQWPAVCRPDLDDDGRLTVFDFLAFQNAFGMGDAVADFDGNGELDLFDFFAFQNAFDAGCP